MYVWMYGWMDNGCMDGCLFGPLEPQNAPPTKTQRKPNEKRPFGDVFCSVVWGGTWGWPATVKTERLGAPGRSELLCMFGCMHGWMYGWMDD